MARLKFGPWGAIIGKLGNHVNYLRKGVSVIKMKPTPSKKRRTVGQKTTTQRFQLVIKFVGTINSFINVGYGPAAKNTNKIAQNLAASYNIRNAIKGEYPNQEIDYTLVRVCEGKLPLPPNIEVSVEDLGKDVKLVYNWDIDPIGSYLRNRDQVMMLAYLPEMKEARYLDSGARRSEKQDSLIVQKNFGSVNWPKLVTFAEVYIAFVSNDRTSVSNSLYCGRIDF